MFVLTKLMDAQVSGPLLDPRKKGIKRKRMEDPVKQVHICIALKHSLQSQFSTPTDRGLKLAICQDFFKRKK